MKLQCHCCWEWVHSRQLKLQTKGSRQSEFSCKDLDFWKVREIQGNPFHFQPGGDAGAHNDANFPKIIYGQ